MQIEIKFESDLDMNLVIEFIWPSRLVPIIEDTAIILR